MNGSAASCPPSAGCPQTGDELRATDRRRSLFYWSGPGLKSMDLSLPMPSLSIQGSLASSCYSSVSLFCCYRFYHYKDNFTLNFKQNRKEGGKRTDCREETVLVQKDGGSPTVGKSQAHSASASCNKKTKRVQAFFLVYDSCCCCLIQASPQTTLIVLPTAPFSAAPPPVWYSIAMFCFIFLRK